MSLTARRPPGLRIAGDLAEDGRLVGGEIEDAVGDDAIDGSVGEGDAVDGGLEEFDVRVAAGEGVGAGALDHGGGHVDADGAALRADHLCGEEDVEAAAGAEVDDHFAGAQVGGGGGIAAGEAHVGGGGDGGELLGGVAEGFGYGFHAGIVAGQGALGDCAVFGADGIEKLRHGSPRTYSSR